MRNVSLKSAIRWAYHVMDYQVSGPDWLGFERYDIAARAAGPVPEEQMRTMLQALLAERFKITLHRETRNCRPICWWWPRAELNFTSRRLRTESR